MSVLGWFLRVLVGCAGVACAWSAPASASGNAEVSPAASAVAPRHWANAPRVFGRLTSADIGLVINDDDPYSTEIGRYYAQARRIPAERILHVQVPPGPSMSADAFRALQSRIDDFFGARVQALAIAWRSPYAVSCNALTGALSMGFDAQLCSQTCARSRTSSYFGSASTRPYADYGMRLSMLLAAGSVESAKAMIDRGVRSDGSLGLRGGMPVDAHFVTTSDKVRSVRQALFPPAGLNPAVGLRVLLDQTDALKQASRVVIYQTGRAQVDGLGSNAYVPGALGDNLTSFGGVLDRSAGQTTAGEWIDAGLTASYGTTSEPCAHVQKFPNPQALTIFYVQGATAIEAYWKSVAWPQQGLFVGEPLAAPFSRLPAR